MAQTLRWPTTLREQADKCQEIREKNIMPFIPAAILAWLLVFTIPFGTLFFVVMALLFTAIVLSSPSPTRKEIALVKGNTGETLVARELDHLPDEWTIINDIIINGSQIDHLVLGSAGVVCIETKHWNNAGTDAAGNWYRIFHGRWVFTQENPALQNIGHVMALKQFLREQCKLNLSIRSVVVLSDPGGAYHMYSAVMPPGDTVVTDVAYLRAVIEGRTELTLPVGTALSSEMVQKVADAVLFVQNGI